MARRPPVKTSRNPVPALTAVVLFVTFLVFLPSLQNGFVTFDDPQYVGENPFIRGFTAENLRQVLTSDANELGNYHPVTLMSYMVNYSLWGPIHGRTTWSTCCCTWPWCGLCTGWR